MTLLTEHEMMVRMGPIPPGPDQSGIKGVYLANFVAVGFVDQEEESDDVAFSGTNLRPYVFANKDACLNEVDETGSGSGWHDYQQDLRGFPGPDILLFFDPSRSFGDSIVMCTDQDAFDRECARIEEMKEELQRPQREKQEEEQAAGAAAAAARAAAQNERKTAEKKVAKAARKAPPTPVEGMRVTASASALHMAIKEELDSPRWSPTRPVRMTSALRLAIVEERADTAAATTAKEAAVAADLAIAELTGVDAAGPPKAKWSDRSTCGDWEQLRVVRRLVEERHTPDSLAAGRPLLPKPAAFPQSLAETFELSRPDRRGPRSTWNPRQAGSSVPSSPHRTPGAKMLARIRAQNMPSVINTSPTAVRAAAAAAAAAAVVRQPPEPAAPVYPLWEMEREKWTGTLIGEPLILQLGPSRASPVQGGCAGLSPTASKGSPNWQGGSTDVGSSRSMTTLEQSWSAETGMTEAAQLSRQASTIQLSRQLSRQSSGLGATIAAEGLAATASPRGAAESCAGG